MYEPAAAHHFSFFCLFVCCFFFCLMNSASPSPLRVPSVCLRAFSSGLRVRALRVRLAVQCRSSDRLHRGAPHPEANLFFPSLSLPLLVFILHLIAVLSRTPPSAPLLLSHPPHPPPPLQERKRERAREREGEREECG